MVDNIELMHSYPDFPNDAIEAFQDLMIRYSLASTFEGIYSVNFENEFCRLNFNMDRYDLQGQLFRKDDDFSFGITTVAKLLVPNYPNLNAYPKTSNDAQSIRQLLFWYSDITQNCLFSVLTGNFDWYQKQKDADLYERKLISVILGEHIDHKHPIAQKFWNGDESWREEIETFVKDNNIILEE